MFKTTLVRLMMVRTPGPTASQNFLRTCKKKTMSKNEVLDLTWVMISVYLMALIQSMKNVNWIESKWSTQTEMIINAVLCEIVELVKKKKKPVYVRVRPVRVSLLYNTLPSSFFVIQVLFNLL